MPTPDGPVFRFPDLSGRKTLILGLGGGCDVLTAYALAALFGSGRSASVIYANTKTSDAGSVRPVSEHLLRVTGPRVPLDRKASGRGKSWIDHGVPRSENGSPWIVMLDGSVTDEALAGEIREQRFDLLIGVDTGGDSIADKRDKGRLGRDQRMLRILKKTGPPLLHLVVAPGSDGEASYDDLNGALSGQVAAGRLRGWFELSPLVPAYREAAPSLGPTRTPCIILAAVEDRLERRGGSVVVPRGKRPRVPVGWLTHGFALASDDDARAFGV